MARLSVFLLGPFHATIDGQAIIAFKYDKVRALLTYLVVESRRPHRRDYLAGLFWPEQSEKAAHRSLRQALSNLRQGIDDYTAKPPFLSVHRDSVQFNNQSDHYLDIVAFSNILSTIRAHRHRRLETCQSCAQLAVEAAGIYQGDFLAEFSLRDSPKFEEWALVKREGLRANVLETITELANFYLIRGECTQAQNAALRQLELDPLRETAYRQLMTAFTLNGQRTSALAQYKTCQKLLRDELGVEPDEETEKLFRSIKSGTLNAELQGSRLNSGSLPTPPSPFVGREKEIGEIKALLENPDCRLISLVGQGGTGKSSLAIKAASEHEKLFAYGACFVSLAPINTPESIYSAIATSLNFSFAGTQDHGTQLLLHLHQKELLIVLDNFEHLLPDGVKIIQEILRGAPQIVILVTTTERLNVQAEHICTILGLGYPVLEKEEEIEGYSAITLFLQNALRHGIPLDHQDLPWVKCICQLVEGIPLALELATSMLRSLSCSEIALEIEKNIDILASNRRDAPTRQQSLRAVFDYSWKLLSEEERAFFRKLSVFRGGFHREAAKQVAGTSLPMLTALIDKSLLHKNLDGRYEMHGLLRRYAFEKLGQAGEMEQTLGSHLEYYVQFAEEVAWQLDRKEQVLWLKRLDEEFGNFRMAIQTALSMGDSGAKFALRLSSALGRFWLLRGYWREGQTWLNQALELGDRNTQLNFDLIVQAIYWLGTLYSYSGDNQSTAALAEKGLNLCQQCKAPRCKALMLNLLGDVYRIKGDYDGAKTFYEQSLDFFEIEADQWGMSLSLNNLFRIAYRQNAYQQAARLAEQSLSLSHEIDDQWNTALALNYLGIVSHDQANFEKGVFYFNQSLIISKSLGARFMIAHSTYWLGRLARSQGNLGLALSNFEESLALYKEMGSKWGVAVSLQGLGIAAYDEGDYARAQKLLEESLELMIEVGDRQLIAYVQISLGDVKGAMGEYQRADILYKRSLKTLWEIKDKWLIALDLSGLANIAIHQEEYERAATLYGAEEAIRDMIGTPRSPVEQLVFDHQRGLLYNSYSPPRLTTTWSEGTELASTDLDAIILYALKDNDETA